MPDRDDNPRDEDEIVMVPVPRSRLQDVYRVLGRQANGNRGATSWEPVALGVLRGSTWLAREVVRPAAQDIVRQDPEELAAAVGDFIRRAAQAVFEANHDPDSGQPPSKPG